MDARVDFGGIVGRPIFEDHKSSGSEQADMNPYIIQTTQIAALNVTWEIQITTTSKFTSLQGF